MSAPEALGVAMGHVGGVIVVRLTRGPYPEFGFDPVCACGWAGLTRGSRFEAEGASERHVLRAVHLSRCLAYLG